MSKGCDNAGSASRRSSIPFVLGVETDCDDSVCRRSHPLCHRVYIRLSKAPKNISCSGGTSPVSIHLGVESDRQQVLGSSPGLGSSLCVILLDPNAFPLEHRGRGKANPNS